jgi:hypothetical protein
VSDVNREAFLIAFLRSLADDFGVCGSRYEVPTELLREIAANYVALRARADAAEAALIAIAKMRYPTCGNHPIRAAKWALRTIAKPQPDTPDTAPPARSPS